MDSPMEYEQPPSSNNASVSIICSKHLSQLGIDSVLGRGIDIKM
jgi:hypothetical protein